MYLNNFQSYIFGAILLFVMGFVACEKTATTPNLIAFGKAIELKEAESIYYGTTIEDGVKLGIEEINDSRCPSNVVCIWAGEAVITLNVKGVEDSAKVKLKITPSKNSQPDTLSFNLNNNSYRVILHSVNPFPNTSKSMDSKKAKITLIKK